MFARWDGEPWTSITWKDVVTHAAAAAELPRDTVAYTLRHCAIADLVIAGCDLNTAAKISGTSLAMIVNHYGKLRQDVARDALALALQLAMDAYSMHTESIAIEYDPKKSAANVRKHGVSFEEAATALLDPHALAQEDGMAERESRWVLLGLSAAGRLLTVVYTLRGDNVRLISARRATRKEERSYAK